VPDPATQNRYTEEQLHALALYLYSLQPPPNSNRFDAIAAQGRNVFQRAGCAVCHTPPLYTNNMLTPADGFTVPPEQRQKYDILPTGRPGAWHQSLHNPLGKMIGDRMRAGRIQSRLQ
jgi:hypothetical protein